MTRRAATFNGKTGKFQLSLESRWKEVERLETIMRFLPCRILCSESGYDNCSLAPIKSIAAPSIWQDVAMRFFHDFRISSEEYLQLTTELKFDLWGIDDHHMLANILNAKQRGEDVRKLVASPRRAEAMMRNCLKIVDDFHSAVTVLITSDLPGRQIGRLAKSSEIVYWSLSQPWFRGDLFDMDGNFVHAIT